MTRSADGTFVAAALLEALCFRHRIARNIFRATRVTDGDQNYCAECGTRRIRVPCRSHKRLRFSLLVLADRLHSLVVHEANRRVPPRLEQVNDSGFPLLCSYSPNQETAIRVCKSTEIFTPSILEFAQFCQLLAVAFSVFWQDFITKVRPAISSSHPIRFFEVPPLVLIFLRGDQLAQRRKRADLLFQQSLKKRF